MKHKSGRNGAQAVRMGAVIFLLAVLVEVPVLAAGENVHLYGALVAEPCVIPPGEENIALDFGTVIDKYLYRNTRTHGQSFSIHLTECDVSLGNTVKVTFLGTENAALPGLLSLDGSSQATGIAIGLETEQAQPVPINTATDKYSLRAGGNLITLKAYVKGEPQAIANRTIGYGSFGAVATFSLEYE